MRGLIIIFIAVLLAGCNDQANRANELAQSEVSSHLTHLQNIKFHDVQFFSRENNGGMVCGRYSDGSRMDNRFIAAIYSQEAGMKATKPFIEGEGTTTDIMNALWQSECK
ncbi:hypothetical protein QTO81_04220 [Klebsiella oxytoca]|uniref:hypothetical protein n=1 Tax=Klebsiella oxytoca TaxID=571 RepID=UPI00259834F3|nr:hypothetical protein [Klebsiella oxytoca]MDM4271082.1 hypothetical protein [Klebsiella oxytoca]HDX8994822.1 hypothetical protein [Klebsiella oxytoca]HDY4040030.1 hypothetical protein [Klebsiella oxytoca]